MSSRAFSGVAAVVFALVALAHAWRAFQALPLQMGATSIPVWVSWLGAAGAGALSLWGFRARRGGP